ncbi:hypothetical protein [Deinococcus hopiensis]|uniref:Uncharacterized protein n=1 Tax=Deinococcus hopiensis KR-140 TaxID=695939 RepID=A0A1W1UFT9_9DEIO|nr:hypothetical protein [Deinococcus hopiensis]SMB79654.1 hypothetical protein SAMN00790413_05292 [Deinococcus hopiensis KR-140]
MAEYGTVVAHFGEAAFPGRLEALEGGRGMMRVSLSGDSSALTEGSEGVLEMHDGGRFRVTVTERLPGENELRMKLLGKG